jgi:hypothetical protein
MNGASLKEGAQTASTSVALDESAPPQQQAWEPISSYEDFYDDLSDLSSIDGDESPPHRRIKEYAKARRAAKQN